jgi:uroporphyrinogen III methyltransferase/synthase
VNQRLVEAGREGLTVCRLKGGDPFMFGRGSEEAAALRAAGLPFEVVPGITAATAAGVYAGISLTHRELSSSVAFITGHEDPDKPASAIDYNNLASFSGTLVFYMGLHRLPSIASTLIECGKSPDTPACVISRATTPMQRTVFAALERLPATVKKANLHAPSLIIIGECVCQRESIAWFEERPLLGQRIAITRPAHQANEVLPMALELGAEPVIAPLIEIVPPDDWQSVDQEIENLKQTDWLVFSSANGVRFFMNRLLEIGHDLRLLGNLKLAAIGSSTSKALREFHLTADVVPASHSSEDLATELAALVKGKRVVLGVADRSRRVLSKHLAPVVEHWSEVVVYQNRDVVKLPGRMAESITNHQLEWITLSSPAIARRLAELLPVDARKLIGTSTRLVSISPITTAAANEAGLSVSAEADAATWPAMFDAIVAAD